MDSSSVSRSLGFGKQEQLLYATFLPPYVYEDGTDDGQAIVVALFEEPTAGYRIGYSIREYSLKKGVMFYRFPKESGHWSRAMILVCPRCDGSGFRSRIHCAGCGEPSDRPSWGGKALIGVRNNRGRDQLFYCLSCHPELGHGVAMLEEMGG